MKPLREKIKKTNLGLFPTSVIKAKTLASKLDRSLSSLIRVLIDQEYEKEFPTGRVIVNN